MDPEMLASMEELVNLMNRAILVKIDILTAALMEPRDNLGLN